MIKPQKVTNAQMAFGGNAMELLPKWEDIPEEFKDFNNQTKWNKITSEWFFSGLKEIEFTPKDGIDSDDALRHVTTILKSFAPKHEHKIAGCAYLLSEFFEDIKEYETFQKSKDHPLYKEN